MSQPPVVAPFVSVVIPSARADHHLDEAIDSVLGQSFPDFEIVLVLDGVPAERVAHLAHHKLRVIELPVRRGIPFALNTGIDAARGRLIARLDADDVAHPSRLDKQVLHFTARPDLVCLGSGADLIDTSGRLIGILPVRVGDAREQLLRANSVIHPSVMFRRSAFLAVGRYDETCTNSEDYELWLRMALVGEIDNVAEALVSYRLHDKQTSRASSPFALSTVQIVRGRRRLAKMLGRPLPVQVVADAGWIGAQILRHWRLRRPAYTKRLASGGLDSRGIDSHGLAPTRS